MKNLNEILNESLFDDDLATRKIGVLDIITTIINDYERGAHTIKGWEKCLLKIAKFIKYDYKKGEQLTSQKASAIKDDELYVDIRILPYSSSSITLIGFGLTGTSSYKTWPPIVRIVFSPDLDNICLDIYRTPTVDYKDILFEYKFNCYKIDRDEIVNFENNIFDKLETIF